MTEASSLPILTSTRRGIMVTPVSRGIEWWGTCRIGWTRQLGALLNQGGCPPHLTAVARVSVKRRCERFYLELYYVFRQFSK